MIQLTEIHDGLFKDEKYELIKSDDFWKLPQNILTHFVKLDKSIHEVVYFNDEMMHFRGEEYPGTHMRNRLNHDAYFQKHFIDFIIKHFIDFIMDQGEPKFYLVRNNGFLLAEVGEVFFVVAPFIPEPDGGLE